MTGETLINGTYDVIVKRYAQGAENGLDAFFQPQIVGILSILAVLVLCYGLYHWGKSRYRQ
jgi:hypothetical protein